MEQMNPNKAKAVSKRSTISETVDKMPREKYIPTPQERTTQNYAQLLNDLHNFVAVGTVDIEMPRREGVGLEAPDGWYWLETPNTKKPMFKGQRIEAWGEVLINEGLMRATYKMLRGGKRARLRLYLLPEDVGRSVKGDKDKAGLRRVVGKVLEMVNTSKRSWEGEECELEFESLSKVEDDTSSLFYIFNTLHSPDVQPAEILDENARDLIVKVLTRDIPGLKTTLYDYQRRSVALMLQREMVPSPTVDSRVQKIRSLTGDRYYLDPIKPALYKTPTFYEDVRGGILAEDMGLGKTLICLALVLASKHQISEIPEEYRLYSQTYRSVPSLVELCVGAIWKHSLPWSQYANSLSRSCVEAIKSKRAYYEVQQGPKSRRRQETVEKAKIYIGSGTLVIVPTNLVEQWRLEIEKHVKPGYLRVLMLISLHSVVPPVEELLKYDVVLISRSRFNKEEAEGKDDLGRRQSYGVPLVCACPYVGSTRTRRCTCLKKEQIYRSPLNSIQWKRIIVDEGHSMAGGARTTSVTVADRLPVERRWIVTGTPTSGLMSVMAGMDDFELGSSEENTPDNDNASPSSIRKNLSTREVRERALQTRKESQAKESNDLECLGRIVVDFLKMQPWASSHIPGGEQASWNTYITKGFLQRRAGAVGCVKNILQRLMIRHLPEDVEEDVILPPLYHRPIFLQPGYFEKLTMNLFFSSLAANAVTSEREDEDYMFHPSQRGQLRLLIGNLTKQSGFFWTGFTKHEVQQTVNLCKKYLENPSKLKIYTPEDRELLSNAIGAGEMAMWCETWNTFAFYHEMGYFVENLPADIEKSWAFTTNKPQLFDIGPALLGGAAIMEMKEYVRLHSDNIEGLCKSGQEYMTTYFLSKHEEKKRQKKHIKEQKDQRGIPASASGTDVYATTWLHTSLVSEVIRNFNNNEKSRVKPAINSPSKYKAKTNTSSLAPAGKKSNMKNKTTEEHRNEVPLVSPDSPLAQVQIVGTASTKLSYLLDQILLYHKEEKILVFYESENVAFYIAEALDIIGIQFLLYAKSLKVHKRAQYIVTFHESERFRVLLMDVSQAAHGLNISSATRVFFVNPIWQPAIEAQALKRAHRIGQTKAVYAETLVLSGTIEEAMLRRRGRMSEKELKESKSSIVDDDEMRSLIENVVFLDVSADQGKGERKIAKLKKPKLVFDYDNTGEGRGGLAQANGSKNENRNVDEHGLVKLPELRDAVLADLGKNGNQNESGNMNVRETRRRKRKAAVRFVEYDSIDSEKEEKLVVDIDADEYDPSCRYRRNRKVVRFV